jgi:hypothetical protein
LWFDFGAAPGARYFAAFARSGSGTVIWYFPASASDHSIDLRERLHKGVLDQVVEIDAAYPSGAYEMYGVLSDTPLSRDEVRRMAESGAPQVARQKFVVDERP